MTKEQATRILNSAIMAPSGENSQPWKFIAKENHIDVFNRPEQDQSLYNWEQRASMIANGAAIENIIIAAKQEGLDSSVKLFPQKEDSKHIARIEFTNSPSVIKDDFYPFINERCTNRKRYETTSLTADQVDELTKSAHVISGSRFLYTQDKEKTGLLGMAGGLNEQIMLSNKQLHRFFFSHVSWTKEEDDKRKMGFFIDTLEMPKAIIPVFKLFRNWGVTRFMNKVSRFNMTISKQNGGIYSSAAGFGVITIKDKTPESFVHAGRMLERIWLAATKLKLSMHPLTGVLFFKLQLESGQEKNFSQEQIKAINEGYENIKNAFDIKGETIAFMFRFGNGGKPSARSSRYALEDVADISF